MGTYQTNPDLALYPGSLDDEDRFVLENLRENRRFRIGGAEIYNLLREAAEPIDRADLVGTIEECYAFDESAASIVDTLVEKGFLLPVEEVRRRLQQYDNWHAYGWEGALDFYSLTRDYPYLDYSEASAAEIDQDLMEEYAAEGPVPPIYKRYPDAPSVDLPDVSGADLGSVRGLFDRSYLELNESGASLDRRGLAKLLFFTLGETGTVTFDVQGEFLLKTVPSGGARHPTEAYVATFDVEGVDPGLYHYDVADHALNELDALDREALEDVVYDLSEGPRFDPDAVVFFSSVLARSMWRYREPRSYRVIMHDVGHVVETIRLVGGALGHRMYFGHGFDDAGVEALLDIDGYEEPVLKFAAVG